MTQNKTKKPKQFNGRIGRSYEAPNEISPIRGQNPYTPSVTYTKSLLSRPSVWKTIVKFKFGGREKPAVVKSLGNVANKTLLETESEILTRLQKKPWSIKSQVGPKLYEKIIFDPKENVWFIASEWFGLEDGKVGKRWENLGNIIKDKKINFAGVLQLQKSLYLLVSKLHARNIYHGDIKDEHIVVSVSKNERFDFSKIRIFDFGLSYVDETSEWKGASIGFGNPFFWVSQNRYLGKNSKGWVDWYSADALLYLCITGECFPATSPAYKGVYDEGIEHKYFYDLEKALIVKWSRAFDNLQLIMLKWLIRRLCKYSLEEINIGNMFYSSSMRGVFQSQNKQFTALSIVLLLVLGVSLSVSKGLYIFLASVFVLLRWGNKKHFSLSRNLSSDGTTPRKTSNRLPFSGEISSLGLVGFLSAFLFPPELINTIPILVGLFYPTPKKRKKGIWWLLFPALISWYRLMLNRSLVFGYASWPDALFIGYLGFLSVIIPWVATINILLQRYKKDVDLKAQLLILGAAWGVSLISPALIGYGLGIIPEDSSRFTFSIVSSFIITFLVGIYAVREVVVGPDGGS